MIYFIQAQAYPYLIKIGFTKTSDVSKRVNDLKTVNAVDLYLILVLFGTWHDEQKLHIQFSAERVKGEWFYPSNQLINFILEKINQKNIPFLKKVTEKEKIEESNKIIDKQKELHASINKLIKEKRTLKIIHLEKQTKLINKIKQLRKKNKRLSLLKRYMNNFDRKLQHTLEKMFDANVKEQKGFIN